MPQLLHAYSCSRREHPPALPNIEKLAIAIAGARRRCEQKTRPTHNTPLRSPKERHRYRQDVVPVARPLHYEAAMAHALDEAVERVVL